MYEVESITNLGRPKIDLSRFFSGHAIHASGGQHSNPKELIDSVSMISMKIDSNNVEQVKHLTTEGLSKIQRLEFIKEIKQNLDAEVFELSTCNRVLYVGFNVSSQELEKSVLEVADCNSAEFNHFTGIDVWRNLVKVCSGLDSFIIGELQVMSQFRGAVAWHKKHGIISDFNGSFFDHVVSANRLIRKEFEFNQTTESMLNLATNALESEISREGGSICLVLGFGEMGCKAVETLISLNQSKIYVISRSPDEAKLRNQEIASNVSILTLDEWQKLDIEPTLVISTIRNNQATYNQSNPLPVSNPATVMDFSWPPSIDSDGVGSNQTLLGMDHWIRAAHKMGEEWNYSSVLDRSELMITQIEKKFLTALTDRSRAKFRAYMYQTMESLAIEWEESEYAEQSKPQLSAFSREIATWICNQEGPFATNELEKMVLSTDRPINSKLLNRVVSDVKEQIFKIDQMPDLPEVTV